MIQSITIENFKGIREPVTLELKPVTLLFGANSSGKSTLLQALHYLCEIFLRQNLDADETLHGGKFVELGGFRNFVHLRDTNKEMRFKFELDCREEPPFPEYISDPDEDMQRANANWHVDRLYDSQCTVELSILWSHLLGRPVVTRYAVTWKHPCHMPLTCELRASLDGRSVTVENFNFVDSFVKRTDREPFQHYDDLVDFWKNKLNGVLPLEKMRDAMPDLDNSIRMPIQYGEGYSAEVWIETDWLLTILLVWPGRAIRRDLRNFRYIGPIREIPRRSPVPVRSPDPWRWANGLAAWDLLATAGDELIEDVNEWLSGEERLHCGYSVHKREVKELDSASPFLRTLLEKEGDLEASTELNLRALKAELNALPTRPAMTLFDEKKRLEVAPQDIGVGISQMLPVVVACLDPAMRILAVEQPELHIHPALQARLGDLFIAETHLQVTQEPPRRGWWKRVILETHSEHLILRLLRRIRETAEGKLPPGREELGFRPEDLNVCYVEPGSADRGMELTGLRVDTRGNFLDRWPHGFFDERLDEVI